ncbi:hypothetical protein GCM10023224_04840 [Streptomonospora halophila]|uniref:Helix-turn-helix domain-containing protein n=1 Tax=Streptomonospora halophila TaxID=427369 RepID=A0ABP9G516_9ACTN
MIRPDDETKPFVGRWNSLIRILLVESSVKHVARAAMDYANLYDGTSCHPSNERLARETGYNERTVRKAWAAMRGMGLAERVSHGVAHRRLSDEYQLVIPESWQSLPVLGPSGAKFTCVHCEKAFNPTGNCKVHPDGRVTFDLIPMVFCPEPRQRKGREEPWCATEWDGQRRASGETPWSQLGQERWKVFHLARGEEW